jgi:phage-related protein
MTTKPLLFVGRSREDLRDMPKDVRIKVGDALYEA